MPFAQRDGRRIHFAEVGTGPAVVLIPGIGAGARLFGTLPRRFARAGFAGLAFDPVGVPPSTAPAGEVGLEDAARDVLAVLDAAGHGRAHLVGTSLGARVAVVAAALAPERVARAALLASGVVATPRGWRVDRAMELLARHLPAGALAEVLAPFLFGSGFQARHPGVVEDVLRAVCADDARRALMAAQARALRAFDGAAWAARVRCPALCMAGAEDTLTSCEAVRRTAAAIPRGEYLEVPGAGHSLLLESGRVFDAVVAFLRR